MATILAAVAIIGQAVLAVPEVRVDLSPSNPGPYSGGEEFTVNVFLHNGFDEDFRLALVRFDFEASDPLELGPQFTFDFSALESGNNFYSTNPNLPRPQTANHLLCFCHLYLPSGGTIPIGSLPVRLPKSGGTYRIDALNAGATGAGFGAFIEAQGNSTLLLRASEGAIVGGLLDLTVTPPVVPAASQWGLLILGLFMAILGTLRLRCVGRVYALRSQTFAILAGVFLTSSSQAQVLVESDIADLTIDSGTVSASGTGTDPVVVFSEIIPIEDATWIRLHFSTVLLSGSTSSSNASFLRITSTEDQSAQVLNAEAVLDWSHTSAYMRGEEVLLELLAFRNTGNNRVVVDKASFGVNSEPEFEVLACEDTRTSWSDDRTARFLFHETTTGSCRAITGCTAFLISNNQNCFLSAGHCCMSLDFVSSCPFRRLSRS